LIEADPEGWLAWLGLPANGPVHPIDSDVSTVLATVDKVLRIEAPAPWLAHVELQASRDPLLPLRLLQYHALLLHRHQVRVSTTVVLLRRQARARQVTGRFRQRGPDGQLTVSFNYRVVRLWERPVDELLAGSLGVLPLAPLADVQSEQLPAILDRLDERFEREAASSSAVDDLWAATLLLMGMRYDKSLILGLGERLQRMRESVTYQMIVEEGIEQGLIQGELAATRRLILHLGAQRFGAPDEDVQRRLAAVADLAALERAGDNILTAGSWSDVLALAGA
jgi:predicted transposase YdaD